MEPGPNRMHPIRRLCPAVICFGILFTLVAMLGCQPYVPPLEYRLDARGGVLCSPETGIYDPENVKAIAAPYRNGYRFAGWHPLGPDTEGTIRLAAQWETLCYDVVFDPAGGKAEDPALLSQSVERGGDALAPEVYRDGYEFLGWDREYSEVTEPLLVRARWKPVGTLTLAEIREQCLSACLYLQTYEASGIPISFGSGFLISSDGYVVTAAHVIRGAARITALFSDGRLLEVQSVHAFEDDRDIAILKLEGDSFPYLETSLEMPAVGDTVFAIGAPAGRKWSVDEGTVMRLTYLYDTTGMIATTLPIKGGSSGGPLIDARGFVVGVNDAYSMIEGAALSASTDLFADLPVVDLDLPEFAEVYAGWIDARNEEEPNADIDDATALYINDFANGILAGAGDEDWFQCAAGSESERILYFVAVPTQYRMAIRARVTNGNGQTLAEGLSSYSSGISGMSVFTISAYAGKGDSVCLCLSAAAGYRGMIPYTIRVIYV